jgi:tetratricopeptide (TPR) repeat protein
MGAFIHSGGWVATLVAVAALAWVGAGSGPNPVRAAAPAEGSAVGNYLAGRFAHGRYDLSRAADFMGRALGDDPDNATLIRQTFLLTAAAGRMTEAAELAARVLEEDPSDAVANYVLAAEKMRAGAPAEAEARLAEVPKENLDRFLTPVLEAWARLGRGDTKAALESLDSIGDIRGFDVLHRLQLGLMNEHAGDLAAAEQAFAGAEASIGRAPFRVIQALGGFYQRRGRADDAREVYRQYAEGTPQSFVVQAIIERLDRGEPAKPLIASPAEGFAETFYHMAGALQRDRASDLALIYGRLALHLRQDFPEAQFLIAQILETMGRKDEAIAAYESVRADSPFAWPARLRVASTYRALERFDEAESIWRAMAAERPDRFDALVQLGQMFRANERFADAVTVYDAAIERVGELKARHWTLFYFRGIALERSDRWARAEQDFLKALELEPEEPYVLNYLGYSWVDRGEKLEEGREMLLRAVELRPRDGYIVDSLGWVYYRLGRYQDAVRQLERAVELRPQDPVINDHLGDVYWRVGRVREARFQWRRVLSLDPEPELIAQIEDKQQDGLDGATSKSGD